MSKSSISRKTGARAPAREGSREWPADQVERWPIDRLIPYAHNARTHSPEQVAQIAASIREFGFTIPVLVDEQDTLIAGHGRVLAAQQLDACINVTSTRSTSSTSRHLRARAGARIMRARGGVACGSGRAVADRKTHPLRPQCTHSFRRAGGANRRLDPRVGLDRHGARQ
jgi:hypothetical protein